MPPPCEAEGSTGPHTTRPPPKAHAGAAQATRQRPQGGRRRAGLLAGQRSSTMAGGACPSLSSCIHTDTWGEQAQCLCQQCGEDRHGLQWLYMQGVCRPARMRMHTPPSDAATAGHALKLCTCLHMGTCVRLCAQAQAYMHGHRHAHTLFTRCYVHCKHTRACTCTHAVSLFLSPAAPQLPPSF